jgi:hypothetical protein
MMEMQPQHISLGTLLHGRLFRIPQYQRAYSWQRKQRQDLFADIHRTWDKGNDTRHFMATIVGLRRERRTILTDDHQVIEIVDGQQRITTLIIMLKAIAIALDRLDVNEGKIGQEIDEMLVKSDNASLLLLQTNHDASEYFADYLRKGIHPSSGSASNLADRELLQAIEGCEQFVARWRSSSHSLLDLVALLKNRLTFVFHEIGDEALVYTVFEVLNSRGLEVSWFDRLKSMLMAIVFESDMGNKNELIEEIHQLWADIYRCVGLRIGVSSEALRFAATLRLNQRPNRLLSEEDAVELLRDQSQHEPAKVIETTKWLKSVTEAVDRLLADRRMNAVTRIAQARLVAVAIHLRSDFTQSEKLQMLRRWENVTFRIYGMYGKDARTSVGDYIRLAWRIVKEQLSADQILEGIARIGEEFPVAEAINGLRGEDCYTDWQEEIRYILYRYEEYLAREAGQIYDNEQWNRIWMSSPSSSIEHILPQSSGVEYVHRLGNLMMLPPGLNSKLGSKAPHQKAEDYNKTGLLVAQDVVGNLSDWSLRSIEDRENALLRWALEEWAD